MLSENLKENWEEVVKWVSQRFAEGELLDLDSIIFIIGLQELGWGFKKYKKDEKLNIMHIAICTLLEPYGYYEFEGQDKDGWPHFQKKENLPFLKPGEQSILMKEAIVKYFIENKLLEN
tara:strand:+ start:1221 stop:1577 length:357 start_codon:yes stop_codon:yes gene_type:complete